MSLAEGGAPPDLAALRPRGFCGYADLLLAGASGGREGMATLAGLLGYRYAGPRVEKLAPAEVVPAEPARVMAPAAALSSENAPADIAFWRLERRDFLTPAAPEQRARGAVVRVELPPRRTRITPLARWSALVPHLRAGCSELVEGASPDIDATVRLLERGRLLHRLPRHRRRRWGERVQIIIDRSERLTPFFDDQDADRDSVVARLALLFPRHAVEQVTFVGGADALCTTDRRGRTVEYRLPEPGTLVVVLGDLGCLARDPAPVVARWVVLGQRLGRAGCRAAALMPCSPAYWRRELMRNWRLVAWDRGGPKARLSRAQRDARAEALLRWVSPAIRVEPGLLRDIRLLCGDGADAATEADVWQHGALSSRWSEAATLEAREAERMRTEFAQPVVDAVASGADEAVQRRIAEPLLKVMDLVLRWHGEGLDRHVWFSELQSLHPAVRNLLPEAIRVGHLAAANQALKDLAPKLARTGDGRRFYRAVYERAPPHYRETDDPELKAAQDLLYVTAYEGIRDRPDAPADLRPDRLPAEPGAIERSVELVVLGSDILALETGTSGTGASRLATLRAVRPEMTVFSGAPADDRNWFWVGGVPPGWAHDWGEDEYGPWVTFRVADAGGAWVVQRMRWCPPGRFLMGSPADEDGRFDDEGPQHVVTLAEGFWMFETPCTQALWEAVMGSNPSHFKTPTRPVEKVSFADVVGFIGRLNRRVEGLELVLPSEAQWEYACRAGTQTATYVGDMRIVGEYNAPVLDAIAWYGGNSGVGFDLDFGYNSSGWLEKQYEHTQAGTRVVGQKAANGWGLHDMLGNVWEWCADDWHKDYEGAPTDGSGWTDSVTGAAERVVRGGWWFGEAQIVRAAYRVHNDPANRVGNLGFRCARVQSGSGAGQVAAPAAPASRPGAERGRPQGTPGAAALLRVGERVACPAPLVGRMVIRSDREELTFGKFEKPHWASLVGRDAFGLFAEFAVPGSEVTQRMRWIPPGRFWMGSPADEEGRWDGEGPRHEVTVADGFWLFETACTEALWEAVTGRSPEPRRGGEFPVTGVSWDDVQAFVQEVNAAVPGLELVLPSEAWWEYACRAGTQTPYHFGEHVTKDLARHDADGPVRVGSFPPNGWGLHEMHGNVWEWCADDWHQNYEGAPSDGRAWINPDRGAASRVIRGGSWRDPAQRVRAAYCGHYGPANRNADLGFRCARVHSVAGSEGGEKQAPQAERGRRRRARSGGGAEMAAIARKRP